MKKMIKLVIRGISIIGLCSVGLFGTSGSANASPSCQHDYEIIFRMLNGTSHPRAKFCNFNCKVPNRAVTEEEIIYALHCEKIIKGQSVKPDSAAHQPLGLTSASAPTPPANASGSSGNFADDLQKGLEEWNRKASCTHQEYKCTYIGKVQESCTWVTTSTC